ncbi:MAG: lysoplasmalogenase family protein [Clostridia bacterium]
MSNLAIVFTVLSVLFAVVFMVIRVKKAPIYGLLSKTFASMVFVAMGVVGVLEGYNFSLGVKLLPFGAALIPLGLAYGMVGDIVLDLKRAHSEHEEKYLWSGMTAFILGHIVYLAAVILSAKDMGITDIWLPAVVSAAIAVLVTPVVMILAVRVMKANFGKFFGISAFYAAFLVFFSAFTLWLTILDKRFLLLNMGMIAFLLSDLVLCPMYFVEGKKEDKLLVVVNHSLYYGAQILIAAWLFVIV